MNRARLAILLIALALGGISALALAATDDRGAAEQTVAELEKDAHTKELCADPIAKVHVALERATRLRATGDDKRARLAEGLALEWANVARELARADAAETRAAAARTAAADAGAHVERERATLEQQLAENGRLQAELAKLQAQGRDAGPSVPPVTGAPRDGGAK